MKEYMLLIFNKADSKSSFSSEDEKNFLKSCETYIGRLKAESKLLSAQPLVREGKIITGKKGEWKETAFDKSGTVQVGYYHILANDLEDAVSIAKANPEFEYTTTASIEVRPIKMKEEKTGFQYPSK